MKFLYRTAVFLLSTALFLPVFTEIIRAEPGLSARAAVLMEASAHSVILERNARQRLPMASTTKIMTALVALEQCTDLSREVSVSEKAVGVEGSSVYLKAEEILTVEQLLYALLLESANDAAAAIAIEIAGDIPTFAAMMNDTAERLGLSDTHFTNPHGLDDEAHYTSAYDLAVLTCYALQNPDFARIVSTYKVTIPLNREEGSRVLINHNRLLKSYSGAIGVKTGYTKRCGRCLVSAAERDGITMVAVTLSAPDDWHDHTAMLDFGFSQYSSVLLADSGEFTFDFPCLGSEESSVRASNHESLRLNLPINHSKITHTVEANRYLCAPISAGDPVGVMIFRCDGKEIARLPLYADSEASSIPKTPSPADRLKDLLNIS